MPKIQRIEINFPTEVEVNDTELQAISFALDRVCERYEKANPGRIMWVFGTGSKMLVHPMMISDDEPIPFDNSTFEFEISERAGHPSELADRGADKPIVGTLLVEGETYGFTIEQVRRALKAALSDG